MMLSDKWIKEQCTSGTEPMISPFVDHSVKNEDGRKVASYGLSCAGYDLRLSDKFIHIRSDRLGHLDPKNIREGNTTELEVQTDEAGNKFVMLPPGITMAHSIEWIQMPRNATALCLIKSTYSRVGVDMINPLIEPEWCGNMTIAIRNSNKCDVKVYVNEGFCQISFWSTEAVETSYADRGGKYQGSKGVTMARM